MHDMTPWKAGKSSSTGGARDDQEMLTAPNFLDGRVDICLYVWTHVARVSALAYTMKPIFVYLA